jgi:hypothetical protein
MANEINLALALRLQKGYLLENFQISGSYTLAAALPVKASGIASIGNAAHEAIPMQDVATYGFALFRNLDATNYVEVGVDVSAAFVAFARILPGEAALVRLGTLAPYAKANAAAVRLQYDIFDA